MKGSPRTARRLAFRRPPARGILLLITASACAHGGSGEQEAPKGGEVGVRAVAAGAERGGTVESVALALDLVAQGREVGSPLLLLTAADLLIRASPVPVDTSPRSHPRARGTGPLPVELDPAPLLEEARRLADGDPALLALARSVEAGGRALGRGAEGGVRYLSDEVESRRRKAHPIPYRGGEPATAFIRSRSDADLRCHVERLRDGATAATGEGKRCVLTWWPTEREVFRVEVRNPSGTAVPYLLVTN